MLGTRLSGLNPSATALALLRRFLRSSLAKACVQVSGPPLLIISGVRIICIIWAGGHDIPIKGLKHTVHGEASCYVPLPACTGFMWLRLSTKPLLRASSLVGCV